MPSDDKHDPVVNDIDRLYPYYNGQQIIFAKLQKNVIIVRWENHNNAVSRPLIFIKPIDIGVQNKLNLGLDWIRVHIHHAPINASYFMSDYEYIR